MNSTTISIQMFSTAFKDLGSKQALNYISKKKEQPLKSIKLAYCVGRVSPMYELIQHPSNNAVRIKIQHFYIGVFSYYLGKKAVLFFLNKIKSGKYNIQTDFIW